MSYAPLHLKRLHACAPSRFMYLRDLHTLLTRLTRLNYAFHAPFLRALNSLNIPNFQTVTKLFEKVKCFTYILKKTLNNDFLFLFHLFNSKVTKCKSEEMENPNKYIPLFIILKYSCWHEINHVQSLILP